MTAGLVTASQEHQAAGTHRHASQARSDAISASEYTSLIALVGTKPQGNAVAEAAAARAQLGESQAVAAQHAGLDQPASGVLLPSDSPSASTQSGSARPTASGAASASPGDQLTPLHTLYQSDLFVVAPQTLSASSVAAIGRLSGVTATNQVDAARLEVNGSEVATLGVDPDTFRAFAANPTATSTALWQNVAAGDIAISYEMGEQEKIPVSGTVTVDGSHPESVPVGGFGTVGITGVDAVVSSAVAQSLGMPSGNALVVSAPDARLSQLVSSIKDLLPAGSSVAPLVAQAALTGAPSTSGQAGVSGLPTSSGAGLTVAQARAFLEAALSRVGMEYVWGGDGPTEFDCSGLVQWSMRQAGIVMPRVAADQALTGPLVAVADLQPGDLLFYHTDPTAPDYISHVAIYLGDGLMVQAPEPGEDVEVGPADFGAEFAGAVAVYPAMAAAVAAETGT